jgi:hypothetical protein
MHSDLRGTDSCYMRLRDPEIVTSHSCTDSDRIAASAARIPAPRTGPDAAPSGPSDRKAASHPLFHKATLSRALIVVVPPWR